MMMKVCLLSSLLFNIGLEVLVTEIRQEKEIKATQIGKEEVKLSLFADDMVVYIENPIVSTKKLLNQISEYSKAAEYKSIFIYQWHFCIPTTNFQKEKLGKIPIYYSNKKDKVPRNKFNQEGKRPVLGKLQNTE